MSQSSQSGVRVCLGRKEKSYRLIPMMLHSSSVSFPSQQPPFLVLLQAGAHPQCRENTYHLNSSSECLFKLKFSSNLPTQHVGGVSQRRAKLQLSPERIPAATGWVAPLTGHQGSAPVTHPHTQVWFRYLLRYRETLWSEPGYAVVLLTFRCTKSVNTTQAFLTKTNGKRRRKRQTNITALLWSVK